MKVFIYNEDIIPINNIKKIKIKDIIFEYLIFKDVKYIKADNGFFQGDYYYDNKLLTSSLKDTIILYIKRLKDYNDYPSSYDDEIKKVKGMKYLSDLLKFSSTWVNLNSLIQYLSSLVSINYKDECVYLELLIKYNKGNFSKDVECRVIEVQIELTYYEIKIPDNITSNDKILEYFYKNYVKDLDVINPFI